MSSNSAPVWLNRIATAVPAHDVHRKFLQYVPSMLAGDHERRMFARLADKAQIEHRFSVMEPSGDPAQLDTLGFYRRGDFPTTAARMRLFDKHGPALALAAARQCLRDEPAESVTHLIVATCTGFSAPGLDLSLQRQLGLRSSLERTMIGFMGCYAAINGLKAAWHIVRSEPKARVLLVNLELCTLHLQETGDLEGLLGIMQFGDGCAASLISAAPGGLEITGFRCDVMPQANELITWHVGDHGFTMQLSPQVPAVLGANIEALLSRWVSPQDRAELKLWAVHPGGRAILDAVEQNLGLRAQDMQCSREVLRRFGNMSSATVMFVLQAMLDDAAVAGRGVAMAFGPGLTLESMRFHKP